MLPAAIRFARRCRSSGSHRTSHCLALSVVPCRWLRTLPQDLRPRFDARIGRLSADFDALTARIADAGAVSQEDAFRWNQLKPLAEKISDLRLLRDLAEETKRMIATLNGGEAEAEEAGEDAELVDLALVENRERETAICHLETEIATMLLPRRSLPSDCPVLLEVKPGVGGLEAMLFAEELFQMYISYARYRGWNCCVTEDSKADLGALRSGALEISDGQGIFDELKHETGTHRVQRIPQTGDVVHTSTASVFAMPKPYDLASNFAINPDDVEMQSHNASGPGGQGVNKHQSAVRLTHKPTGVRVDCQIERTHHQNLALAQRMLLERVLRLKLEALADEERLARAVQDHRGRSDRIRTYNYQQGRVTDHRVRLSHSNLPNFMSQGQHLKAFIAALQEREELAELEKALTEAAAEAADSARC